VTAVNSKGESESSDRRRERESNNDNNDDSSDDQQDRDRQSQQQSQATSGTPARPVNIRVLAEDTSATVWFDVEETKTGANAARSFSVVSFPDRVTVTGTESPLVRCCVHAVRCSHANRSGPHALASLACCILDLNALNLV
jgi:hypothetical protein